MLSVVCAARRELALADTTRDAAVRIGLPRPKVSARLQPCPTMFHAILSQQQQQKQLHLRQWTWIRLCPHIQIWFVDVLTTVSSTSSSPTAAHQIVSRLISRCAVRLFRTLWQQFDVCIAEPDGGCHVDYAAGNVRSVQQAVC